MFCYTQTIDLTVKSVVDTVNHIVGLGRLDSETALVLLDKILLGTAESLNSIKISYTGIGSIGNDLSCNTRVKTRHLKVHTDIG